MLARKGPVQHASEGKNTDSEGMFCPKLERLDAMGFAYFEDGVQVFVDIEPVQGPPLLRGRVSRHLALRHTKNSAMRRPLQLLCPYSSLCTAYSSISLH